MTERLKDRDGDQPLPVPGQGDSFEGLITRLRARKQLGIERYGRALQPYNGRNTPQDAMEEILDLAVYMETHLQEMNGGRRAVYVEVAAMIRRSGAIEAEWLAAQVTAMGALYEGAEDPTNFFVAGLTYEHEAEGIFLVKYVGRAPEGFEHFSETLGVASGWRRDARAGAVGVQVGDCGAYTSPDFAGWELYR